MVFARRRLRSGDVAFVALLATSLAVVQSYSFSSLFGGKPALGLRSQGSAFCQGSACKATAAVLSTVPLQHCCWSSGYRRGRNRRR